MIPFPDKKYDIIYADPAWNIVKSGDGYFGDGGVEGKAGTLKPDYPLMTTKEIMNLPVQDISKDDCLLFMWIVSSMLEDSIEVGKTWGFTYSTIAFVWEKQIPIVATYTMRDCEICLLFKRGKIPRPIVSRSERQFLSCKRGKHSEKPLEIKHRIDKMFPIQSKIELFARPLPMFSDADGGWDYWGNEVETLP